MFNDHDITKGVEAVIDKDHTSAILAVQLNADVFVIATDVDRVAVDFGKLTQRPLDAITVSECRRYLAEGQFPAGSMGPKISAAITYLERGGTSAIITDYAHLVDAIQGRAGTKIIPDREPT